MRTSLLLLLFCLAACSGDPRHYGITGPGAVPAPPEMPDDASVGRPGIPDSSSVIGPSITPSTGTNRYWGYN